MKTIQLYCEELLYSRNPNVIRQTVPDTLDDEKWLKLPVEAEPEKLSARGEKQSPLNVSPLVKDGLKALWVICLRDLRYRPLCSLAIDWFPPTLFQSSVLLPSSHIPGNVLSDEATPAHSHPRPSDVGDFSRRRCASLSAPGRVCTSVVQHANAVNGTHGFWRGFDLSQPF